MLCLLNSSVYDYKLSSGYKGIMHLYALYEVNYTFSEFILTHVKVFKYMKLV